MAFALQFTDRRKKLARIQAGSFTEEFVVSVDSTTTVHEEGWRRELGRLLRRKTKIALPVAGHPKAISRAWVVYRKGDDAYIQDCIFPRGFDPKKDRIPPRETVTSDGHQISEWPVSIAAIDAFLRGGPIKPVQHNAGSRPVSAVSPTSASPSLVGPRG